MYRIHIAHKQQYGIQVRLRDFGSVFEDSKLIPVEIPFLGEPEQRREIIIGSNASTYNLSHISIKPHLSSVYINGVMAQYGVDYMIDNAVFNWLSTMSINGDTLIIDYI